MLEAWRQAFGREAEVDETGDRAGGDAAPGSAPWRTQGRPVPRDQGEGARPEDRGAMVGQVAGGGVLRARALLVQGVIAPVPMTDGIDRRRGGTVLAVTGQREGSG